MAKQNVLYFLDAPRIKKYSISLREPQKMTKTRCGKGAGVLYKSTW